MYSLSVLVPTYQRPQQLIRCLAGIIRQSRRADEIIVIARDNDYATTEVLKKSNLGEYRLRVELVSGGGQIAALNRGLEAANSDLIVITDDDTVPRADWLKRVESHFVVDPQVGGVGGRDWVHESHKAADSDHPIVGKLQWFGRVIGNHHRGIGPPRDVDILKGANMSYRSQAIVNLRFDERLRGQSAQAHNEIMFCLTLRQRGWRLIYDPQVAVDHYPAPRFGGAKRDQFAASEFADAVHNEALALLEHLSQFRASIFLVWAALVGPRHAPGVISWLRLLPTERALAGCKWKAAQHGRRMALRTLIDSQRKMRLM